MFSDRDGLIEEIINSPESSISLDAHIVIDGEKFCLTSKEILDGVDQEKLLREFLKSKDDNTLQNFGINCRIDMTPFY